MYFINLGGCDFLVKWCVVGKLDAVLLFDLVSLHSLYDLKSKEARVTSQKEIINKNKKLTRPFHTYSAATVEVLF